MLAEVCGGDEALLSLTATLLDTERRYRSMARRVGVLKALEDTLDKRGFATDEDAVQRARARERLRGASSVDQLDLLSAMTGDAGEGAA